MAPSTRRRIVNKCIVVEKKAKPQVKQPPQVNNCSSSSSIATKKSHSRSSIATKKRGTRAKCRSVGCTNGAVMGGVCITHGAKQKRCIVDGCTNHNQKGGVCITHGAKVKRCSFKECTNQVVKGGVCVTHGATRKQCSFEGCTSYSQKRGFCKRHSSKNINATKNNHVTPVIASCRSVDYEEEEELNSWIWRSNARPSQSPMKGNLFKKQQDESVGSQIQPVLSKTKAKNATKTFAINSTQTTPILEAATGSSRRLSSSWKTTGLSHQDMTENIVSSEQDVTLCIVCEDAKKVIVLLPCKHFCLCKMCASTCLFKTLHECPMCREMINDSMEVYW
jgi:hypothetical protein